MILRSRPAVFAAGLALGALGATWVVFAATGHTRVAAPELPKEKGPRLIRAQNLHRGFAIVATAR